MGKPRFHLTRHAAVALRDIHAHSLPQWGTKTANNYVVEIYAVMAEAAVKPEIGRLRSRRSAPFFMIPAGRHFVVYDRLKKDIVILAVLHQRRDIERVIAAMKPAFLLEIETLRKGKV